MLEIPSFSKVFSILLNIANKATQNTDIENLEGRSFVIAINEFPQNIGIAVEEKKIIPLDDEKIANADVIISGNLRAVLNMVQNESNDLDSDELYISGKMNTAKNFQHFMANLAIDWQHFFAQMLPPDAARKTSEAIEQGILFAKSSKDQLVDKLSVYLLEEKKLIITKNELYQHKNDLQQFCDRLDKMIQKTDSFL